MSEIVPADFVPVAEERRYAAGASASSSSARPITRSITFGHDYEYRPEPFDSERLPVTLSPEIQKFLRVANLIEPEEPRIAYLCRLHAFIIAHKMDCNSIGRGVRQFKTSLLKRLEQDEEVTIARRREESDIRELRRVYHAYKDYIIKNVGVVDVNNKEKMTIVRTVAQVLFEVLKTLTDAAGLQAATDRSFYVPYNILPLDPGGAQQAIMQLPEIKAAVTALRSICRLPSLEDLQKDAASMDLFDLLQSFFGFQEGNVANQREHLLLLLANAHVRHNQNQTLVSKLGDAAIEELMKKFFKNYTNWCKYLGKTSNIRVPNVKQDAQQYKLLYIGLHLLIWGEAANLRFMPECLCYIFHHMANELHGILTGVPSPTSEVIPAYGGGPESFLNNVVTPIYRVIYDEAEKNKNGTAHHFTWRNYDDLNEYFWSPDCFEVGWPMRLDRDYFHVKPSQNCGCQKPQVSDDAAELKKEKGDNDDEELGGSKEEYCEPKWLGKTNFVEIRSFWQIFRSFDRMWSFLILILQAMIIMACHDLGSPLQLFDKGIFEDVLSIFITSTILKLLRAIIDIAFTWKLRNTMDSLERTRHWLNLAVAAMWTIILPTCYAKSRKKYTCYSMQSGSWLKELCFSPYMIAVGIYMMSNAVQMVLFFVPAVRNYIEVSNCRICTILSWWTKPRLFIGRGMQESQLSQLKYTLFWLLVLSSKFSFSYFFEIKPLITPTRQIMRIGVEYDWHELFPKVRSNAGAIMAIWAPVIVVYFMDAQIWYSVFCTIFGGVYGILHHLGEIRTLGMLRSRFHSLPSAFNARIIPPSKKEQKGKRKGYFSDQIGKVSGNETSDAAKFAVIWNEIIRKLRLEDLISDREVDLMAMPLPQEKTLGKVRWPVFLLANKLATALCIAEDFVGKDENLYRKISKDKNMYYAVQECFESMKYIVELLAVGDTEKRVVSSILKEIDASIGGSTILKDFNLSCLPALRDKAVDLLELLLDGNENHRGRVVKVLQDIFELVTQDMMIHGDRILDILDASQQKEDEYPYFSERIEPELFESAAGKDSVHFPLPDSGPLNEQIKRFYLLLTVKDAAVDVPFNLEARRRISFFATSLFMDMPSAPTVRNMLSFSVLTPHYMEDINYSMKELLHSSQEEVSIIHYMKKIYPDEWSNFGERMGSGDVKELKDQNCEELRNWASFRGQTLSRTVRGMMYYREALKLQAFLDMAGEEDILEGCDAVARENPALSAQLEALADLKFTYVVSCQMYGSQKSSGDPHAKDVLDLMIRYPSLRVAHIEEKEEIVADKPSKTYSSILVKAVNGFDQDNYLEEAMKMRNLLEEFHQKKGHRPPTILGLREHIFTGSVSSLAWFMSYQETSFVTIGQRLLANPLRVRFHYGHPDVFDRIFHITRGGISKASKTINLSEDVFAGFNCTLRRGSITYHEYMQVGKGRDVGLNQISKFEAKVANGNSEQTLSRDIYRLGQQFDFFRMLSCYFTTIGFYFNSLISVIGIYVFLYGQLYLVLSGLERALILEARVQNIQSLETALGSQSFIQLGLLTGLPMVMEIGLEKGFLMALKDFILMQLQLAAVFFTFSLGTKTHYYGRTILCGGAKYRPTGRKVVVFHASFSENYRLYSRSHFTKGFELLLLLIVYDLFRRSYQSSMAYVLITYSIWFMSITWLFAPFLFNPSGFTWDKIVDDWKDWNKWINLQGGIGVKPDKSWESWWYEEQAHIRHSGLSSRLIEILLSLRFFLYQYGLVYHLDISQQSKNFLVYVLSWVVIFAIFLLIKGVNMGQQKFSAKYHFYYRLFKAFLFLGVLSIIVILSIVCKLSLMDIIVCCLAFLPTGWGLILVGQAVRPKIENTFLWEFTLVMARAYDYGMGVILFAPMACLAWLPIISAFQTRFLFNDAFNRQLEIYSILDGKKNEKNRQA
ncbi:putative callose synthase 8 isoform X2 [Syzygium oleosum]|uniref:putative callose synthase 8 isoform X2 n=1 Tax=Syzygium oleosum TaxID=219896 RepID=UPI0024B9D85E|nr:putative callose synthase 8 isoform X2 [Syzygium oleosum]